MTAHPHDEPIKLLKIREITFDDHVDAEDEPTETYYHLTVETDRHPTAFERARLETHEFDAHEEESGVTEQPRIRFGLPVTEPTAQDEIDRLKGVIVNAYLDEKRARNKVMLINHGLHHLRLNR